MMNKKSLQIIFMIAGCVPALAFAESLLFQSVEVAATGNPYAILEAGPDGDALYAINNSASPTVERFTVRNDGVLINESAFTSAQPTLEGATSAVFSPNGDVLLIGNNSNSSTSPFGLYAFSVSGNGFEAIDFLNSNGGVPEDGLFDDINVTAVAISPDGNNIYVTGTETTSGNGVVAVLGDITYSPSLDRVSYTPLAAANERVLESDSTALSALDTPVDIAATANGVYVISDSATVEDALIYFTRNTDSGVLTFSSFTSASTGVSQLSNPADLLLAEIGGNQNIFIAAAGSNTIIQFEQTEATAAPALKRIYGQLDDNGTPNVAGLGGVFRLIMNSSNTVMHAAAIAASRITSFYVDDGILINTPDPSPVVEGGTTTGGVSISGIAGVNLLALGADDAYLYATSSLSSSIGLARFSRQSNLSVDVTAINRGRVQPGELTAFSIVLENEGPADAPRIQLSLTPSHAVTDISVAPGSSDLAQCVLTSESNAGNILCEGALLANGGRFSVEVTMRPTLITTASIAAQAISGNQGGIVSDRDSITVGSPKNGSLAIGLWAHLLLLFIYLSRQFTKPR